MTLPLGRQLVPHTWADRRQRTTWRDLGKQRIATRHVWEPAEVPVGGPELVGAVVPAERGDPRVMHLWADDAARRHQSAQLVPVAVRLAEQDQRRGLYPRGDLVEGELKRRGRAVDPRMGDDAEEFVDARPGDGPGGAVFSQFRHAADGAVVPGRILSMGVDKQIRVDGDQAPRPS